MHTAPNSVLASCTFDAPRRFPWCDPPAGVTLTHDDVHVWRVALEVHEGVVHQLEDRLAADEQLRADRFQFAQDRRRFVVRRGVLRAVLGWYLGTRPERLRFECNRHGKPSLAGQTGVRPIRFNLAHSADLAVIAVTHGREVGVDVERLDARVDSPVILEGLGSSLNDGMVNPTGAHFQVLNALDTAMAPSEIIAIVERCPSWRASGLFVRGCKVRKVQPTKEGAFELEYRFKLTRPSTGDKVRATIVGKIYPDEEGEQEYKKILESLKGQGPLVADSALTGFVQYVPELRLLLASPSADAKLPSLRVALDPHAIKPFLADCLNRSMHWKESLSGCEVDILRYRPGKRCVLRYRLGASRLEAGDVHERSFIGKAYGNGADGADVFAIMLGLYRNRFGRDY